MSIKAKNSIKSKNLIKSDNLQTDSLDQFSHFVPLLRFPVFEGVWVQIKLGNLLWFKNGLNADKEKYGRGVKFINVLDIINNQFITYDNILGSVEVTIKEIQKNKVEYGDILFQRSSETREEVGQANVYLDREKIAVFGGFVIRGKKKVDYNPVFMKYLLQTGLVRKEITSKSGGSTRYNVGQSTLEEVLVYSTTLPEQQKIASFLSAVDQKIQQLTRKKELLEQHKKGVMQKLFSQEIRFKREDGSDYPDWEEKKLGDLGQFIGGGTPLTKNLKFWKGDIPWISSSDLNEESIYSIALNKFITQEAVQQSATKLIPPKSILIVSRVGVGKVAVNEVELCTSQDYSNLVIDSGDYIFFAYLIKLKTKQLLQFNQGTSIKGFVKSDLKSLKLLIPILAEQNKISEFLVNIDWKIERTASKAKLYQQFKKGLLQQMFV